MPYIDHDDEKTRKAKEKANRELSAKVYTRNKEYFRDRDAKWHDDGLSDEERYRRNRERDEQARQAGMKKYGWGVYLHVGENGKYYHYIIDENGKKKKTDSRGNSLLGDEEAESQIMVLFVMSCSLIPISIGAKVASTHQFSTLQAMLAIWLSAFFLTGGIAYFFSRMGDRSSRFGKMASWVRGVIVVAVLLSFGWGMGLKY